MCLRPEYCYKNVFRLVLHEFLKGDNLVWKIIIHHCFSVLLNYKCNSLVK